MQLNNPWIKRISQWKLEYISNGIKMIPLTSRTVLKGKCIKLNAYVRKFFKRCYINSFHLRKWKKVEKNTKQVEWNK